MNGNETERLKLILCGNNRELGVETRLWRPYHANIFNPERERERERERDSQITILRRGDEMDFLGKQICLRKDFVKERVCWIKKRGKYRGKKSKFIVVLLIACAHEHYVKKKKHLLSGTR